MEYIQRGFVAPAPFCHSYNSTALRKGRAHFQNNAASPSAAFVMSASQNDMSDGRTDGRRVTFMHAFSVKKARGLNIKGKNGTNDVFVTIGLGKEKYQTSVKEKATENVEWCEQCEL